MKQFPFAFVLCLFLLAAGAKLAPAQTTDGTRSVTRPNTWTARSSTGVMLGGTWTAKADPQTGAVTGTWTLVDARGRMTANGAWSASKSATAWEGQWRAAAAGRRGEYSGTWRARVELKPGGPMGDLFERALQSAVTGNWRAGRRSGTWSIQAFR